VEAFDLGTIVSILLALVATVAGGFWLKAKGKLAQASTLFKEAYEVVGAVNDILQYINTMLADNTIEKTEIVEFKAKVQHFKDQLLDVKVAFLKLIGKA
jgi:hypothetical protein